MNDFFTEFPRIELGDVILREIQQQDVESFYKYISSAEVIKYLADSEIPSSVENARVELMYWGTLFMKKSSVYWAIADKKSGEIIGTCGFNSWSREHRRVEISYDLSHQYWSRGIMTNVVKHLTEFAFSKMNANRIQATIVDFNKGSIRVLEKCGYKEEGLMKNFGVIQGNSHNFYMYSNTR
jgi:[ribosomal protein S5]-alanine N-acetyltransferase